MVRGVHPFIKDTNDRNTIGRDSKVNHVQLNIASAVFLTNMVTGGCRLRDSANTWNAAVSKSV